VVENQRRRLIQAVPAAVCEKGFGSLTVEDICSHAGVSRRTFYENFRMAVIEVLAAGPSALAERDRAIALLRALIGEEARRAAPDPAPRLLLEVIAGAILQLIYGRVLDGETSRLEELLPTIMYMVLVALHGPSGAAALAGTARNESPAAPDSAHPPHPDAVAE
jgi:AcrR family transcriptional regulator